MSTTYQGVIYFDIHCKTMVSRDFYSIIRKDGQHTGRALFIPTFQSEPEKPTFDLSDASDAEFRRLKWIHGFKPHILTEAPALRRLISHNAEKWVSGEAPCGQLHKTMHITNKLDNEEDTYSRKIAFFYT